MGGKHFGFSYETSLWIKETKLTNMHPLLEITGKDIGLLSDSDLRTLVGKLCEADCRNENVPATSVTYGGDQNTPDGGIDVRVTLKAKLHKSPICRLSCGFQVKATKEEELEQLTTLKLPAKDLANLEAAALRVGVPEILAQAVQIELNQNRAAWRKRVGKNAENAFVKAMNGIEVELLNYGNGDEEIGPIVIRMMGVISHFG